MQTCKELKDTVESPKTKDYWTRVAAHLVWRNDISEIEESRFLNLFYINEGYAAAMDKVIIMIKKAVHTRATFGYDKCFNDDNDDADADETEMVLDARKLKCIKYWSLHVNTNLEFQTRMKLLEHVGTSHNTHKMTAHDCLTTDMKEIAKYLVMQSLVSQSPNHDPVTAARLRKWARDFADLPGISNETKAELMKDLRSCMMHRWEGNKMLKVSRGKIQEILGSLFDEAIEYY